MGAAAALAQAPASGPAPPPPARPAAAAVEHDAADADDDKDDEADQKQRESARATRRARLEILRAAARNVTWEAPTELKELFEKYVTPPELADGEVKSGTLRVFLREVNRKVPEIAASEGYFSTQVATRIEGVGSERRLVVSVAPGPRTIIDRVIVEFEGDIARAGDGREDQRAAVEQAWTLPAGRPFRQADWDDAKSRMLEKISERYYANASIADSVAIVEAGDAKVMLKVILESGPRYTFGPLVVTGLKRYPIDLVQRYNRMEIGQPYELAKLLELQRALQNAPWFASVAIDIDREAAAPQDVPVNMTVIERAPIDVGLSIGYGTDTGARAEVSYRHRDVFNTALDMQSAFSIDKVRQVGFADFYLPALSVGGPLGDRLTTRDSFGFLVERKENNGLETQRVAFAAYRAFKMIRPIDDYRVGLSYQFERKMPDNGQDSIARALAPVVEATWRWVDDLIDPKKGGVLKVRLAAGGVAFLSTQDFVQAYGTYQQWIPFGENDQVLLRGEIGRTFAVSREGIPEDFLFKAGGSRSNRGYAYESLGARDGDAVVGGRFLLTASAEYVHWFGKVLGGALFYDIGDAADERTALNGNPSYGVGVRVRTPAGPLALDVAYAEKESKVRVSFSVSVAF